MAMGFKIKKQIMRREKVLAEAQKKPQPKLVLPADAGRVRIYLKHPGDFKYVKNRYGREQLTEIPNKDFMYAEASPGQPCTLQGLILRPKYCKYEVVLEALDGFASGITYVITNY